MRNVHKREKLKRYFYVTYVSQSRKGAFTAKYKTYPNLMILRKHAKNFNYGEESIITNITTMTHQEYLLFNKTNE